MFALFEINGFFIEKNGQEKRFVLFVINTFFALLDKHFTPKKSWHLKKIWLWNVILLMTDN